MNDSPFAAYVTPEILSSCMHGGPPDPYRGYALSHARPRQPVDQLAGSVYE